MRSYKILFFGDVVGALGREGLVKVLPSLQEKYTPDLVVANVENLAHGVGVTQKTLNELVKAGVDAFTGGNHSWDNPLGAPLFEDPEWSAKLSVPTNFGAAKGGKNAILVEKNGAKILIANVMGQLFTHPNTSSPFTALEKILAEHEADKPDAILVDIHAEATAEKEAFGHFADGKVSSVFGSHTHVPTNDLKILPGGTAYLTDLGRCGAYDSVLGFEKTSAVKRFLTDSSGKYDIVKSGQCEVNGVALTLDLDTHHATKVERIREIVDI
jgi:metallophosphoesterase (TIGR00282 family)